MRNLLTLVAVALLLGGCMITPVKPGFEKDGKGVIVYSTRAVADYEDTLFAPTERHLIDIWLEIHDDSEGQSLPATQRQPSALSETVWVAWVVEPGPYDMRRVRESRRAGAGRRKVVTTWFRGPGSHFEVQAGEVVYLGQFSTNLQTSYDEEFDSYTLEDAVKSYDLDADDARAALAEHWGIEGVPIRTVDPFEGDSQVRSTYRIPFSKRPIDP